MSQRVMMMDRSQAVKLEPAEPITVKHEVVENEGSGSTPPKDNDNPSENAGSGHSGKPKAPPAPRIGPIRTKHKRLKSSPYEIDPRFKWNKDALPFISKPDERPTYTPRATASATRTSAAAPAGTGSTASTSQEDRNSSVVDLSEFEKFLGKSLFPVKMPPVRAETSANPNRSPNILINPVALANSTGERTSKFTKTDSAVTEEIRQPRRAKSPSLLTQ